MELLDLSARNRLLNIPRSARSARIVEVIDEKVAEVYRLLVRDGRGFTFLPGREASRAEPTVTSEGSGIDEIVELAQPEDTDLDERGVFARHSDTRLQTRLTSQGLQKRLLELYTDAITLEQEQGVNILYLALGTLKWIDPKDAALVRYAPLILVPVTLERGTASERFKLKARAEDISSNLSLEAYLDRVHKIRLPELDLTDDFNPSLYMRSVADAVRSKERWEVNEDDIVLGFFSFAKFLMYRDLDPTCWPTNAPLAAQPIVRSMLAEGFARQIDLAPEETNLDALLKPADMIHIVDCDSSRALAVNEVRRGRNLVIQGPPGTGKSQTIANLIASAVADGKTVLFVAEKMAALDVVKRRLDGAGVGDACLELHSNKANKRQLLQELSRVWDLGRPRGTEEETSNASLLSTRDELNAFVRGLHLEHERASLTPFQVMGELARLHADGVPPTDYPLVDASTWTPDQRREREQLLDDLRERIALIGHPADHAWRDVDLPPLLPTEVARLATRIETALGSLRSYLASAAEMTETLQSPESISFAQGKEMEVLARRIAAAPALSGTALRSEVWAETSDLEALVRLGVHYQEITSSLHGRVNLDEVLRFDGAELAASIQVLAALPQGLSEAQLSVVPDLLTSMPNLREAATSLNRSIGRAESLETLPSMELLLQVAVQIAKAPHMASGAFSSPRWEDEVERANDIAEALAKLEKAKEIVGNQISDAGWQTNLSEARQVLGEFGTSWTRFFSGRWRQQNRFLNSFLTNPKAPLNHKLALLDGVARGREAYAEIDREKEFGSEVFGPEWRGAKSASTHLLALTEWMRGLKRFSSSSDRTMIRSLAATRTQSEALQIEIAKLEGLVRNFWHKLSSISQLISSEISFEELSQTLRPIAQADAQFRQAVLAPASILAERVLLLKTMEEVLTARSRLAGANALGASAFGEMWRAESSDWDRLQGVVAWVSENQDIRWIAGGVEDCSSFLPRAAAMATAREQRTREVAAVVALLHWKQQGAEGELDTESLRLRWFEERLGRMLAEREQLSQWTSYQDRSKRAKELGLRDFVGALEAGAITGENLLSCFHASYYEALLQDQLRAFPELARFDGALHERKIGAFRSMDLQHIKNAALTVARTHHRRIPPVGGIGPVAILRGQIAKRRAHMPIRQLMLKAAPVVQALKPVMMMSPLSVAQFLSPGHMAFDLLVMDEASQIQPVDALGAVARCRQIVVVGDERQLPPTKFFSKLTNDVPEHDEDDETGAEAGDVESVLGLCLARGLPQRMLRWHYRSRHQSLIAVSNSQFYENKLKIIPSPYTREAGTGLRFIPIASGVFESGSSGANPVEAKAVAEAIIRHALDHPALSLGVATFSVRQRKAIQDHLELMRRANPVTEAFFSGHSNEPFFIKNLENVQGDERDVIFISVGYGRNENGFFAMRFGPLGSEGGERRLNVLISRAKRRCDVFASITDEDIDTDRAKGKGVLAFKLFLQYARTGHLQMGRFVSEDPALSAMGDQVECVIQAWGYQVHRHVGLSGLFLDLAVADPEWPGRYILGIELDGPSYADAQSARDRDRLRNAVLRDHGWQLHRIWAMDWLQRPAEQTEVLLHAIKEAREAVRNGGLEKPANATPIEIVAIERGEVTEVSLQSVSESEANFYKEATLTDVPTHQDFVSTSPVLLSKYVQQIVAVEGPVHRDEVMVRLRFAWHLLRSGGRIQAAVDVAIRKAISDGLVSGGDFLYIEGQKNVPRDRSVVTSPGLRRIEMLPPTEIDAAILRVVETSLGGTAEQVVQSVSRMLGFKSTSSQLRDAILGRQQSLVADGRLAAINGIVQLH